MRPINPLPGRHLLVASTGGHLAQLVKWAPRLGASEDSLWVTFESPQSQSLLQDKRTLYLPYIAPRGFVNSAKALGVLMSKIRWGSEKFNAAISTGAAVGLPGLAAARLHRVPSFYIESVSRVQGPSLTGRIVSTDPWISTTCQYEHWANRRWIYRGSLFDSYTAHRGDPCRNPRVFVSLGTIRPYRFDALIDAILATGLADERTVWQLGVTDRRDLPGTSFSQMERRDFTRYAQEADVVITHSGVGTLMDLLDQGIFPVVVPRRAHRGEHVDDHQLQVAGILTARQIAKVTEVEELKTSTLLYAAEHTIQRAG